MPGSYRVILVGVGGATCSGKTTLAKQLSRILPDSILIHQDDFVPPRELAAIHPVHNVQDWDTAAGAIAWDRLVEFLRHIKETGVIPPNHRSHDHLNEHREIKVEEKVRKKWIKEFEAIKQDNERIIWGLVDGFLLYWNKDVVDQLDVRIMLRVPHDVLKQRRHERHNYHIGETSWQDPPGYWEDIIYPAFLDAHKDIFMDGDVEHGQLTSTVNGLILIESLEISMSNAVEKCCSVLKAMVEK